MKTGGLRVPVAGGLTRPLLMARRFSRSGKVPDTGPGPADRKKLALPSQKEQK